MCVWLFLFAEVEDFLKKYNSPAGYILANLLFWGIILYSLWRRGVTHAIQAWPITLSMSMTPAIGPGVGTQIQITQSEFFGGFEKNEG